MTRRTSMAALQEAGEVAGSPASDYDRVARAIHYIRENRSRQPSLAEIAARVNLSEYHFQRLFSRWAGVSPKRYLQALTLEQAKAAIRDRQTPALAASYEVGLSSSSRLYDHFVQLEAVTPSEYRDRGEGLSIDYGWHDTPYGPVFIATTSRGICQLDFVEEPGDEVPLTRLRANWPGAAIRVKASGTKAAARLFSNRPGKSGPISLWVRGTNFQINVWRALLAIPPGTVATYGDVARMIGRPNASRAVGRAIGANPVALCIPCHRVIRQSGDTGGYRWGETRKHAILVREAARSVTG